MKKISNLYPENNKKEYNNDNFLKSNDRIYMDAFNKIFNNNLTTKKEKDFATNSTYLYLKLTPSKENNINILSSSKTKSKDLIPTESNNNELKKVNEILIDFISPISHEKTFSIINNFNSNYSYSSNDSFLKKRGRKKIGDETSSNKNKYSLDNKINKFKTTFYQKFIIDIANILKDKSIITNEKFIKINKKVIKDLNIKKNLILLNSNIEKLFSYEISDKYFNKKKQSNKNLMDKIKNLNEFNKLFFETKICDLYKIFIQDNCSEIIKKKFSIETNRSLKYYLKKINDLHYRNSLEETWKNIYVFFDDNKIKNQESEFL